MLQLAAAELPWGRSFPTFRTIHAADERTFRDRDDQLALSLT